MFKRTITWHLTGSLITVAIIVLALIIMELVGLTEGNLMQHVLLVVVAITILTMSLTVYIIRERILGGYARWEHLWKHAIINLFMTAVLTTGIFIIAFNGPLNHWLEKQIQWTKQEVERKLTDEEQKAQQLKFTIRMMQPVPAALSIGMWQIVTGFSASIVVAALWRKLPEEDEI
ncbi:MAG: DUF4199 domain-containing protein [Chlorobi bacterium]|nr:DUF4199 domain-containing protein [Chlorobiota bacterium]